MSYEYMIVGLFLALAAINDYKEHKVKNKYIFYTSLLGFVVNVYGDGMNGLKLFLLGIVIPFAILYPFFLVKLIPAGDIKLFMAIGSLLGYKMSLNILLYSLILGGFYSIILVVSKRKFLEFKKFFLYLKSCFIGKTFFKYDSSESIKFPLAPIVFLSYIVFIYSRIMK